MTGRGGHLLMRAGAALLAIGASARAQYATSIPFAPYSGPNRAFSYPTVTNPSLPNQARLQAFGPSMGGATTLDLPAAPDLFSVDPYGTMNRPTGNRFVPYHAALRTPNRFDQRYTRQDQEFAENQTRRDELYFELRSEQDPKRRAELAEELGRVNEALRSAGAAGRRSAARPGAATAPAATPNRRTSRGTPLAVPPAPVGAGGAAPRTPPAAGAGVPSAGGVGVPPPAARDIDPDAVLERSRRLDAAGGMARPPGAGEVRPTAPGTASLAAPAGAARSETAGGVGDGGGDAFGGRAGSGAFGGAADAFRDAPRSGMSRVRRPGTRGPGR